MLDFLYVAGTIAFFAAMLLYVRACQRLGRAGGAGETHHDG
jgi:hypothetical protein